MISTTTAHSRRLAVGAVAGALMAVLVALFCLPGRAAPTAAPGGTGVAAVADGFPAAVPGSQPGDGTAGGGPGAEEPSERSLPLSGSGDRTGEPPSWSSDDDGSSHCKRPRDRGTDPAVPASTVSAHDQCPVLGARLAYAEDSMSEAARGLPDTRDPTDVPATPVTLSVLLRV
ncbi:hypothetical protein KBZ10_00195 [Streptomyces sp. F63]|uniref:hypothetical protein n=1 Tax=Streptomyces sp. F63 TaxID=2824887 RepID=UPI001B386C8D|nr:hypothetical protein [Streptomyces sp. F63]MBQ0982986.1 hypothetical protein [Streptomyces sp. F63]